MVPSTLSGEEFVLDITPVLNRELLASSRKEPYWWGRALFVGILVAIAVATFGARFYWDRGQIPDHQIVALAVFQAFIWMVVAQMVAVLGVFAGRAALSIALEKDRRTADFLLTSRLSNAEIILGKLAACLVEVGSLCGTGLPIFIVLCSLGALDPRLLVVAGVGLGTTAFFMMALGIAISTGARNVRVAASGSTLLWVAWLILPFLVSTLLPRVGIHLPELILTVNSWLLASSPLDVFMKFIMGGGFSAGFWNAVGWMCGLQLGAGVALILWATWRLRSAYRSNVSGDETTLIARLLKPGWRWRPKPPVGDDPILWREMHTSRSGLLAQVAGSICSLGIYGVLAYVTVYFGWPAMVEAWRHGYSAGITSPARPEMNLAFRFFVTGPDPSAAVDAARTDFNFYLRFVTSPLVFLLMLIGSGFVAEGIYSEVARETWSSLLGTPLSGREILRAKILAAIWRMRALFATIFLLWSIGLLTGAVHPIGILVTFAVMAAATWLALAFGAYISIGHQDRGVVTYHLMGLTFLTTGSALLPFILPARMSSVLLGSMSPPFVTWLSLVSFRDLRNGLQFEAYPLLEWIRLGTGEGLIAVAFTCAIGIAVPAIWGYWLWRSVVIQFDRLVGRPHRRAAGPILDANRGQPDYGAPLVPC